MTDTPLDSQLFRLWDAGQRHLAGGHYMPARRALESAEALAWRQRDARTLARLYLPLLEARRQIRYQAAEGVLVIGSPYADPRVQQAQFAAFLEAPAGTILLACSATAPRKGAACLFAGSVQYAARRTGRWLEALLLVHRGAEVRVTSQAAPTFSAGLPVRWVTDSSQRLAASTDPALAILLPPPGIYQRGDLHAVARESLITCWEALALKWQHRHPPGDSSGKPLAPWEELAWLRLALRIDPACEPITMRLIALAEAIERSGGC